MPDYITLHKALELACEWIAQDHQGSVEAFLEYFIAQAKGAVN